MEASVKEEANNRVALQKELAASETRFHTLICNSTEGIVVLDHQGVILLVNPVAASMFSRAGDDLTGELFGYPILISKKTEVEFLKADQTTARAEMRVVDIEWEGQAAYLATFREISEPIALSAELDRVNRELEQLTSIVAHDVRSPLRNLYLLTGWLQDDHSAELNAEAMEDIRLIRKSSSQMQRILEDLLHYRRVDRVRRISRNISLDEVLDDALDNLADDILRSGLQLTREKLPHIDCNFEQMVTFFQHAIGNVIVHCAKESAVHVSCKTVNQRCHICISDNGPGIAEANLSNIFIPFNNLHSKGSHEGSGVGLAASKKVIERHGGRIWIESEVGAGSALHAVLPLHLPQSAGLTKPAK